MLKRVSSLILCAVFLMSMSIMSVSAANRNNYTTEWIHWSQGATAYGGKMKSSGCRVVAQAKLLAEVGIVDSSFDPDKYIEWAHSNGYFGNISTSFVSYIGEQAPQGIAPSRYASAVNKTLNYCGQISFPASYSREDKNARIMEWLKNGYYVILGCTAHHVYVPRALSLQNGTPMISESQSGLISGYVKSHNEYSATSGSAKIEFTYARLYSTRRGVIDKSGVSATVTTSDAREITQTSATLYGSVLATGAAATEVGMYLGTSSSNMSKLGSDAVHSYSPNMWYNTTKYGRTLEPDTTYYYKAYAMVGGILYEGNVKTFTTQSIPKQEQEIEPDIQLDHTSLTIPDGESTYLYATTQPKGQKVTWSSSNTNIVAVSSATGQLIGVNAGTAVITAQMSYHDDTYTARCTVTVEPSVTQASVSIDTNSVTLTEGTYTQLVALSEPKNREITWSSSAPSIATVSESGKVTAVTTGTAVVTASMEYNGITYRDSCTITVERAQKDSLEAPMLSLSTNVVTQGDSITATWTPAASNATYYLSYSGNLSNGAGDFITGWTQNVTSCSYRFTPDLEPGVYQFHVVASNEHGRVQSNTVTLTVQAKNNISISWSADYSRFKIGASNATVAVTGTVSGTSTSKISTVGIYLYDNTGKCVASKDESVQFSGNYDYFSVWYNVNDSLNYTMSPGSTYKAKFFAVIDDTTYTSPLFRFTTSGS